jgi:hypothetical protein
MLNRRRLSATLRSGAVLLPLAAILVVVWPNIMGRAGLGPETIFDLTDPLFGSAWSPPPGPHDDPTPVVVDWPRDRRLRERVRGGHFDLWNPTVGNGTPLIPDPGGVLSPLRLVLYAAPVRPYTAFVLFRVCRLLLAALGTYLLARTYRLSRPASVVASIGFGLSGGMISQVPFAEVASVCWLPWVCWAQTRMARLQTRASLLPIALTVAATLTGGHQPIIAGVMLGAGVHLLGLIAVQGGWRARGHAAARATAGYALGALLAAPALLPFVELMKNGHTYKSHMTLDFRKNYTNLNRLWLFVAAIIPHALAKLRGLAATNFPYVLNFSCGALTYLLASVAVVRRRWPLEFVLLLVIGVGICFTPPGFGWIGEMPLLKDIVPRYMWSLVMLPVAVAAGFGADALADAVRAWTPPAAASAGPDGRRRVGLLTTRRPVVAVVGGVAMFLTLAALLAYMLRKHYPAFGEALVNALGTSPTERLSTLMPVLLVLGLFAITAALLRWRNDDSGAWLLAIVTCVEMAVVARPHLREPPSRLVRDPPPFEAPLLAERIAATHGRVSGTAPLITGWQGWPEVRSITPLAPRRYVQFVEIGSGPVQWTYFGLPGNRSALSDLAGIDTLIVPLTAEPRLDGDPEVTHTQDIRGVSVFHNQGAAPRARVVHNTLPVADATEAVARLTALARHAPRLSETPLANAVILEPDANGKPAPALSSKHPSTAAAFVTDEPDKVIVQVDIPEEGYLVLADTHYPGWRATVDGRSVPIHPANVGFRAVHVEAGKHRVAFRFRPTTFWAGVILAIAAAALCAAIGLAALVRPRRQRHGGVRDLQPHQPGALNPSAT